MINNTGDGYICFVDFIIKEGLPLTPIGKIDYKSLENEANI